MPAYYTEFVFRNLYDLFFIVAENVRSPWREFLALHELRLNKAMVSKVLGNALSIELVHTPTAQSPSYDGSQSTVALKRNRSDSSSSVLGAEALTPVGATLSVLASSSPLSSGKIDLPKKRRREENSEIGKLVNDDLVAAWSLPRLSHKFNSMLKSRNNLSQLHAIKEAFTGEGFTLVQGPPGT